MTLDDIGLIVTACEEKLDLQNAKLPEEYYYHSLPLCVIDAVFSIGANYRSTRATVVRFCDHFNLPRISRPTPPPPKSQLSIHEFFDICNDVGDEKMAETIYQNRQRTSTKNGILKAEAVRLFSFALFENGVNYLQDITNIRGSIQIENAIRKIPGQRSGISLNYFYMLSGSDNLIKPDRMIRRFIQAATGFDYPIDECERLVIEATRMLQTRYPDLSPRVLDNLIWRYQREI